MVSITIRSDQEGPEPDVQEEIREMAPCSLALVTAVRKTEKGQSCEALLKKEKDITCGDVINGMACGNIGLHLEIAGDSRVRQARILAAYMESFVSVAAQRNGTAVMDQVREIINEGEPS